MEKIILAGGCFWCLEAIFNNIIGVISVKSGYANGKIENPTYEKVCNGDSGFAEAVEVEFDSKLILFEDILKIFFNIHDPTELNRQGNDIGNQYRSGIYFINKAHQNISYNFINSIQNNYKNPVVTEVLELRNFYFAEKYHNNYFNNNLNNSYCDIVILPKLKKARSIFKDLWKD